MAFSTGHEFTTHMYIDKLNKIYAYASLQLWNIYYCGKLLNGIVDRVRHVECVPLEHAMHVRLVGALLKSSSICFVVKLV